MTHASKMHQSVSLYIGKLGPACVCFYYHIPSELDGRAMPIDIQLLHTYVQLCTVATYCLLCFYADFGFLGWGGLSWTWVLPCSFKCDLCWGFHVTSAPCDFGHITSHTPPQLALRIPFHLGKPLLTDTRHTHHDHAHCDSHSTAGCLHRTASSYYLVIVHVRRV